MSKAGQLVVACLGEASNQNPAVIKQAEERLKQWETEPGFYSILLTIFFDFVILFGIFLDVAQRSRLA